MFFTLEVAVLLNKQSLFGMEEEQQLKDFLKDRGLMWRAVVEIKGILIMQLSSLIR